MTRQLILAGLLAATIQVHGQGEASPETKLRAALRTTTLQLRDGQNELAILQAEKADNEQKVADMAAELESAKKEAAASQSDAEAQIGQLTQQTERMDAQLEQYRLALVKWKRAYNEGAEVARKKEDERAKAFSQAILLQRRIDEATAKNREMYKVGNEILNRYERLNLGDALLAREPFIGVTRVKIQNLMQDYRDDLTDQRVKPAEAQP